MGRTVVDSIKLYLQVFLASFLCFIICTSFSSIFYSLGTHNIGYKEYALIKGENGAEDTYELLGTYYFESDDEKIPNNTEDRKYESVRSERPKYSLVLEGVISQTVMLVLYVSFVNTRISKVASRDRTGVMYQGQPESLFKGFVIGGIASIPAFIVYLLALFLRLTGSKVYFLTFYRVANCAFLPLINAVLGNAQSMSSISVLESVLISFPIFVLPVISGISYMLKYKNIDIKEKIMYKK